VFTAIIFVEYIDIAAELSVFWLITNERGERCENTIEWMYRVRQKSNPLSYFANF